MKRLQSRLNNTIMEGVSIPFLIVLYGIPAVLLILFGILITLGIRLLLRQYRAARAVQVMEPEIQSQEQKTQNAQQSAAEWEQ